jgi:hypothetical protein
MNENTLSMRRLAIATVVLCALDTLWRHLIFFKTRPGSTVRYDLPFEAPLCQICRSLMRLAGIEWTPT